MLIPISRRQFLKTSALASLILAAPKVLAKEAREDDLHQLFMPDEIWKTPFSCGPTVVRRATVAAYERDVRCVAHVLDRGVPSPIMEGEDVTFPTCPAKFDTNDNIVRLLDAAVNEGHRFRLVEAADKMRFDRKSMTVHGNFLSGMNQAFSSIEQHELRVQYFLMNPETMLVLENCRLLGVNGKESDEMLLRDGSLWGAVTLVSFAVPRDRMYFAAPPEYVGAYVRERDSSPTSWTGRFGLGVINDYAIACLELPKEWKHV